MEICPYRSRRIPRVIQNVSGVSEKSLPPHERQYAIGWLFRKVPPVQSKHGQTQNRLGLSVRHAGEYRLIGLSLVICREVLESSGMLFWVGEIEHLSDRTIPVYVEYDERRRDLPLVDFLPVDGDVTSPRTFPRLTLRRALWRRRARNDLDLAFYKTK